MGGLHSYVRLLGLGCHGLRGLNRGRGGVEGGIGRGDMVARLRPLLCLSGLASISGRRSAAGAKTLVIF